MLLSTNEEYKNIIFKPAFMYKFRGQLGRNHG
jgi:hypothetical protein